MVGGDGAVEAHAEQRLKHADAPEPRVTLEAGDAAPCLALVSGGNSNQKEGKQGEPVRLCGRATRLPGLMRPHACGLAFRIG